MDAGEKAMVGAILKHKKNCDLCKEKPKKPAVKTVTDPDWNDDKQATLAINNQSGELDSNMGAEGDPRPTTWSVPTINGKALKNPDVTPNPHHLIPGNESLKVSPIKLWIIGGDKIEADIGYNVNNARNGVWLPSNNSMRGQSVWGTASFTKQYVIKTMEAANGHFHDRHVPYSNFVKGILNKIAARMDGIEKIDNGCPYVVGKKKGGKWPPPYFLVNRLNGVSKRLSAHLKATSRQRTIFTSKYVKMYYWPYKDS